MTGSRRCSASNGPCKGLSSWAQDNDPLYLAICQEPDFRHGKFDTSYLENHPEVFSYPEPEREIAKLGKLIAEIHARKINKFAY